MSTEQDLKALADLAARLRQLHASSGIEDLRHAADALEALSPSMPRTCSRAVFEAGWDAGFQEALTPDTHPDQDRCAVAYAEWLRDHAAQEVKHG
jgi:hypothetical protein